MNINKKQLKESIFNNEVERILKNTKEYWQENQIRITDKELLSIFPEAKNIIPKKIKEWDELQKEIKKVIKTKLNLIKNKTKHKFTKWFFREWIKINEVQKLLEVENQINRLKRLSMTTKGLIIKGRLSESQIQDALSIPIDTIAHQHNIQLKKVGLKLIGLCPFHNEKSPSFYIYLETNSFYCFGCQKGGNVITLIMLINNYSFKEAVLYLIKNK